MKHRISGFLLFLLALFYLPQAIAEATVVDTKYEDPKALFDFYLDDPQKMGSALYWVRSYMNPLMDEPYSIDPEFMQIVVVIHGSEIVTVAKKNYEKYEDVVGRMRYYAEFGVKFKVCGLAAHDYGYLAKDFYDFIELVPSAITELVHWQQQGFGLITPTVVERTYTIESIR